MVNFEPAAQIKFNREVVSQIPQVMGPRESLAFVLREFIHNNEWLISSAASVPDLYRPVELVLEYFDILASKRTDRDIVKDHKLLFIYGKSIALRGELVVSTPIVDNPSCQILSLISTYLSMVDFEASQSALHRFLKWVKDQPYFCPFPLLGSEIGHGRRRNRIISYREFSQDGKNALWFVLDSMLESTDDPFRAREIHDLVLRVSRIFSIDDVDGLIYNWIISTEISSISSSLLEYMHRFHNPVARRSERNWLGQLTYYSLFKNDVNKNFETLLQIVPALVSVPGLVGEDLSGWMVGLAFHAASKGLSEKTICDSLSRLAREEGSMNAWDSSIIESHFGQFGLGLMNPVAGLIETGALSLRGDEHLEFPLVFFISKLYTTVDVAELVQLFESLADSREKPLMALIMIGHVFHSFVVSAAKREHLETSYLSVFDSIISIIQIGLLSTGKPAVGSSLFKEEYIEVAVRCLKNYFDAVCVLRLSYANSRFDEILNHIRVDCLEFFFKALMENDDLVLKADLIPVLSAAIVDGATDGLQTARQLGINAEVQSTVIYELLVNCWDADIDPFLIGLPPLNARELILQIVNYRVAVVVQCMCEDTSRLHGLVVPLVAKDDLLEKLMALEPSTDSRIARNIRDWLTDSDDGILEILESCRRLLFQPFVGNSDEVEVKALLRGIRSLQDLVELCL